MKRLNNDNRSAKGLATINMMFILAFVGLIVAAYLMTVGGIFGMGNVLTTEKVIKPVINPFQKPDVYVSAKRSTKASANVKKQSPAAENKAQLKEHERDFDDTRLTELDDKEKVMLSMFFMLLKHSKSADGKFN